jgi:hypothetical protein
LSQPASAAVRAALVLATCLIAMLAVLAPAASADNVVYVAGDGNVWISSPDGSVRRQITDNATSDSKYRSPSEQNDGTVVAIRKSGGSSSFAFFFNPDSGAMTGNWLLPASGSSGLQFSPFTGGEIAPSGGMMVYDFFHAEGYPYFSSWPEVAFVAGPGLTDPCTINCHDDYLSPRWIPGTNFAGFIDDHFQGIWVQNGQSVQSWVGIQDYDNESFDVSGQGRTLLEISNPGSPSQGTEPSHLVLLANNGTAPNSTPTILCSTDSFANVGANPKWSPDGSRIAWEGPEGVYVSPAPQPLSNGACGLSPKLLAPGGHDPDWGPRNVPGGGGSATGPKCFGKKPTKVGNAKANVLRGTPKADVIDGLGGNDTLIGLGGNDRLCGGAGNDKLKGGPGKDSLLGGAGKDVVAGGPGKDVERK